MEHTTKTDRLLRDREVMERLGCSRRKVWDLAARGALETVKLGPRCTRFRSADVDRIIREGVR